jgi:hypothetical protein
MPRTKGFSLPMNIDFVVVIARKISPQDLPMIRVGQVLEIAERQNRPHSF